MTYEWDTAQTQMRMAREDAEGRPNANPYGFRWGPMNVVRRIIGKRGARTNYVLGLETDHHDLEISVSGAGRSVRVWLDGKELTP